VVSNVCLFTEKFYVMIGRSLTVVTNLFEKLSSLIENIVFRSRFCVFVPITLAMTVLVNGIWVSPASKRMWLLASNPFKNPFDNEKNEWLLDNYLLPWLAHTMGADTSLLVYVTFCLFLFLFGIVSLAVLVRRQNGELVARCMLIVFALSPVSLATLGWLGYVDFITVFFGIVVALSWEHLWVLPLCAFLMGLNHASQGIVISLVAFLAHVAFAPENAIRRHIGRLIIILAVILIAYFLRDVYLTSYGVHQTYTRLDYFHDRGIWYYASLVLEVPGLLWYSLFGAVWILLIAWVPQASVRSILLVSAAFIISLASALLNLDQTRVFSLLTFPVLLVVINNWPSANSRHSCVPLRKVVVWMIMGSLILPKIIVWHGKPYGSVVYHDIQIGVQYLLDRQELNFYDDKWLNKAFGR